MADLIPFSLPFDLGFETSVLAGRVGPSSIKMYTRDFIAYLNYSGSPEKALDAVTLDRWITDLVNTTKMSPNTINRMVSAVKKTMRVAAKQGYITHEQAEAFKHVDGVKVDALKDRLRKRNRVRIEPEQMRALIDSIDTSKLVGLRNKALFTTLASSGLRVQELANLKPEQIKKRGKGYYLLLYAEKGKNQKEDREANISIEAVEAIGAWLEARSVESEYIFTSFEGRGNRPLDTHITPMGAWKTVKSMASKFGLEGIKPHDFRRFVGTQLAKKDLRKAQKALGHKRIETTAQHYVLDELEIGLTDNLF